MFNFLRWIFSKENKCKVCGNYVLSQHMVSHMTLPHTDSDLDWCKII